MKAADDYQLHIAIKQMYGDPAQFAVGTALGSVGVMLHNRRRNKLNGVVESLRHEHMSLRITHSLGNCPKYIQGTIPSGRSQEICSGDRVCQEGIDGNKAVCVSVVRTVVLDDSRLASLGSEERLVERGEAVLGKEQRAFIARSTSILLACCQPVETVMESKSTNSLFTFLCNQLLGFDEGLLLFEARSAMDKLAFTRNHA